MKMRPAYILKKDAWRELGRTGIITTNGKMIDLIIVKQNLLKILQMKLFLPARTRLIYLTLKNPK